MKSIKLPALLFTLLTITSVFAQQGEIIYTEFDPPLEIIQNSYGPYRVLDLDFDGDGWADHRFYGERDDYSHEYILFEKSFNGWRTRMVYLDENDTYTFDENDTIIPAPNGWSHAPRPLDYYYPNQSSNGIYHETYGMRKVIDGKFYYGWYHGYGTEGIHSTGGPIEYRLYIDKIAYCTIPDYPLRYGQTSLTDDVEEHTTTSFATIHPNPTSGTITIMGKNLQQAEVVNLLGQPVLSVQGEDDELRIDMTALPAGVYFVNVTDSEGRKCVQKVVKE